MFFEKEQENIVNNLCTGCGACVSESENTLKMDWNEYGFIQPVKISDNELPHNVIRVCPFNPAPESAVATEDELAQLYLHDTENFHPKVGRYIFSYAGYSHEFRESSSSGGIATYVFRELLRQKVADCLFIVTEHNGSYSYQFFDDYENVTTLSKTRYIPVTMETLFSKINDFDGKVAVSGVACFIKAIRLKQYYHPELKDKISFLVGIICGGWKSRYFSDYLAQEAGITQSYHKAEYRVKHMDLPANDYSFSAVDANNVTHSVRMRPLGDMWGTGLFKSLACEFCTDVLSELPDISLGDAWLQEYKQDSGGTSVVITRSRQAESIMREGISLNRLALSEISIDKVIQSQSSSFSHRHDGVAFRLKFYGMLGVQQPNVRSRLLRSISIPYMAVQVMRSISRSKSLVLWSRYPDISIYNKKMKKYLLGLSFVTKLYHKARRAFR